MTPQCWHTGPLPHIHQGIRYTRSHLQYEIFLYLFNIGISLKYWHRRVFSISMLKYKEKRKQVAQRATIAHLSPMCQGQISFRKIQTHPRFNACSCYMKVAKGSNQNQQRKSGNTIFPIIRSIGVFLRRSRAANSVVGGPIWPKFELIHNIMHVLVTSKFEKDRININRDYVMHRFLDAQGQLTP